MGKCVTSNSNEKKEKNEGAPVDLLPGNRLEQRKASLLKLPDDLDTTVDES